MTDFIRQYLPFTLTVLVFFILLLLAGGSGKHARYRRRAGRIYAKFNQEKIPAPQMFAYLRKVNPYVFEELVLLAFEKKGYRIKRNKRYSGDGGVDGVVFVDGREVLIQCKRYFSHINALHVKDFADLCERRKRAGAFVHTGRTGRKSWEIAHQYGDITFISGSVLVDLMMRERKISIISRPLPKCDEFAG